ncbi:ATP-binding SpoIIE family protein phosphatase [Streptomyces millisiae]|uniref:SpoIIE family protein phosphatase n=1 Tax=Streptomyces millisiae TaxID=3075542 RepID=A0ABU2LL22_9ACTN|nr:SpoIIE family protein phosphatase [Streptomyces sp. DSM 44918]MDT0318293.1 SpoIIE family protein phosphatase [Streptomyces sp. DSM 44918]
MAWLPDRVRRGGVLTLLLVCLALVAAVSIYDAQLSGRVRWAGFTALAPVVAGALLPFWPTLMVGAVALGSNLIIYGLLPTDVTFVSRLFAVGIVAIGVALGITVCRVRLDREQRVRGLTIARERLTLLTVASQQVGSTLDVSRTAQELADVAVPRLADFVCVDLFDPVLRGEEPEPGPIHGPLRLRRVAQQSVLEGVPEAVVAPGDVADYPEEYILSRCLAEGRAVREPMRLPGDRLPEWLELDPKRAEHARKFGFNSGIAVPLRARGTTLGVAVFIRHQRQEPFDDDDLLLAEEVCARAAVCVDNARRYTHEHRTALTLQRSMLPRRLPRLAAVDVATRYLPAGGQAGVGGDWYDVIQLSGARVALVVGDVVGHGLYATATMGRLRSAVRTLADIDLPPDELLTHLDDVMIRLRAETEQDSPGGGFSATCLYAVYDPVSRACTVARAGHPLPALVLPDGRVDQIELPAGPPLGIGGLPFESAELLLPEDSVLVMFTNGLLESRSDGTTGGIAELREALSQPVTSLESACDALLKTMLQEGPRDDVALLLARTHALDTAHVATWDVTPSPEAVATARELATGQLAEWGLAEAAFTTELVVSELVTNAIRHAGGPIQLRVIREHGLICEVSDGSSTSPHLRRARVYDESGRGLFIVAQLTDRWGTRQTSSGKTIWAEFSPDAPLPV